MIKLVSILTLVAIQGIDNQIIWVNPVEVLSVRTPRPPPKTTVSSNVKCLIELSDGKGVSAAESCDDVRRKLNIQPEK